ncbi:MAG: hypothetical protein QE263_07645 [Vampirovibrionales bacterium]|nr:hypothetical protein [Vampirovibrionales bacterium]
MNFGLNTNHSFFRQQQRAGAAAPERTSVPVGGDGSGDGTPADSTIPIEIAGNYNSQDNQINMAAILKQRNIKFTIPSSTNHATINLLGGEGNDTVGDSGSHNKITANTMGGADNYFASSNYSHINVNLGSGDDTFYWNNTVGTHATVIGGDGNDTLNLAGVLEQSGPNKEISLPAKPRIMGTYEPGQSFRVLFGIGNILTIDPTTENVVIPNREVPGGDRETLTLDEFAAWCLS